MGTNYYFHKNKPCPTCGHPLEEPLHIGKSSAGWCFALKVYPEGNEMTDIPIIKDLDDWVSLWLSYENGYIVNEYGGPISKTGMMMQITDRSSIEKRRHPKQWYERNYAEPGPNNLARHTIDNVHCIGHGSGTWDLIKGEFS